MSLLYTILSFLPMFVCFFGALSLASDRPLSTPKRYLVAFLVVMIINYLVHASYFAHVYESYAVLENIWVFTSLSSIPLYYYYIRLQTVDRQVKWRTLLVLLLPALLLGSYSLVVYLQMSTKEVEMFVRGLMYHQSEYIISPTPLLVELQETRLLLFKICFALQIVILGYLSVKHVREYHRAISNFYSSTEDKRQHHMHIVFYAFLLALIISFASNLLGKDFFVSRPQLVIIPSLSHSIALFVLVRAGKSQTYSIADYLADLESEEAKAIKTNDTEEEGTVDHSKKMLHLDHLMAQEEWYLDPNLRISDIATKVGSNRTYLSNLINSATQSSFNEWVNGYRVRYAAALLHDDTEDEKSLVEIGQMSGFSSNSCFYRVFKQHHGVTPGKYRTQK